MKRALATLAVFSCAFGVHLVSAIWYAADARWGWVAYSVVFAALSFVWGLQHYLQLVERDDTIWATVDRMGEILR